MRKLAIAVLAALPIAAVGAYALAQPAPSGDEILAATPPQPASPGQPVAGKRLAIKGLAVESGRDDMDEADEGTEADD